jgi:V/A-type H+-transporting ATPase subunit G/H
MKTEVLKSIKKTEEEYKSTISTAEKISSRRIADARLEADNLVKKAIADAEEYKKMRLADAQNGAEKKHDEIISKGKQKAASVNEQSRSNNAQAVELLVTRFKEKLNV